MADKQRPQPGEKSEKLANLISLRVSVRLCCSCCTFSSLVLFSLSPGCSRWTKSHRTGENINYDEFNKKKKKKREAEIEELRVFGEGSERRADVLLFVSFRLGGVRVCAH